MNTVIMVSVVSIGVSGVYGGSRCLTALSQQGYAPKVFSYVDRSGRPLYSVLFCLFWGVLAYINLNPTGATVFNWLVSLSGMAALFTWGSICFAHIRFRKGWKLQGHSLSELAFKSQPGVIGSWIGFIFNCIVLIGQFWVAMFPIDYASKTTSELVQSFFSVYLALPVTLLFYFPYKFWYRTKIIRSHNMDLHTGIRELNVEQLIEEEKEERKQWPTWKKVYKFFC